MSIYGSNVTDGNGTTVTTVSGDATIEGAGGTQWLDEISVGDTFKIEGESAEYQVAAITDEDTIELTATYEGDSAGGRDYLIIRDFTDRLVLPLINRGDLDWPDIYSSMCRILDGAVLPVRKAITVSDTPYTQLVTETYIGVNCSGGAVEVDIVSAASVPSGHTVIIKDESGNSGSNNITVDQFGSETIDGSGTALVISSNFGLARLMSDGTNWRNIT